MAAGRDALDLQPLTLGVTGHRPERLASADLAVLRAHLRGVLEAFAGAAGPGRPLRLVSNLAEGADTIAAEEARAIGWTLDVVLPFPRQRNAEDFADPAALAALEEHLAQARSVFALGGWGDDPDEASASYERAGRVMLAQSDVLLAVWDGEPARGRGGSAQIVAEAVDDGIPVIHVWVQDGTAPELLWDRLDPFDIGERTLTTVPRGGLDRLPELVAHLTAGEATSGLVAGRREWGVRLAVAYSLLVVLTGVRTPRRADFSPARPDPSGGALAGKCARMPAAFADNFRRILVPGFALADAVATNTARLYRSAYVSNFALAALAVIEALAGLVLPHYTKPFMVCLELATIASILAITWVGRKARWHERWLDSRQIAEQLRTLALAARLGDLRLRHAPHPAARGVARRLGLPDTTADESYLAEIRSDMSKLLEGQVAYLDRDANAMHRLEHRLHRLGEVLFGGTALVCLLLLVLKFSGATLSGLFQSSDGYQLWGTILSAALPAIGAAIYGIRMQGDFAGTAERSEALAGQLRRLHEVSKDAPLDYDVLLADVVRAANLLTTDLSSWLHSYKARPLALPG